VLQDSLFVNFSAYYLFPRGTLTYSISIDYLAIEGLNILTSKKIKKNEKK
jgi:hypothetical protein